MDEIRRILLAFACEAETIFGQEVRAVGSTKGFGHWNPGFSAIKTSASTYPKCFAIIDYLACLKQLFRFG